MGLLSIRATLALLFDRGDFDESLLTFTRASVATYFDANGIMRTALANVPRLDYDPSTGKLKGLLIEESRTNLIPYTEGAFGDWVTSGVLTKGAFEGVAPDGKATAFRLGVTNSGDRIENSSFTPSNGTYTFSVWLKSLGGSFEIGLRGPGGGDVDVTMTNEWKRFSTTIVVDGDWDKIQVRATASTGTQEFLIWGAQLEEGNFATSYIPNTTNFTSRASSASYIDSEGVLHSKAIDEERTENHRFFNGKWIPTGQFLESSATNLIEDSEDISDSSWSKVGTSIDTNATQAPDGSMTADKLEENSADSNHMVQADFTITTGVNYTASFFAKADERNQLEWRENSNDDATVTFTLTGNGVASSTGDTHDLVHYGVAPLANGWYRCWVTVNKPDSTLQYNIRMRESGNSYQGVSGHGLFIWGAQLELGSFPSSYIYSSGASATRTADVFSSTSQPRSAESTILSGEAFESLFKQKEGTFIVEFESEEPNNNNRIIDISSSDNDTFFAVYLDSNNNKLLNHIRNEGNNTPWTDDLLDPYVANTVYKSALRYSGSNFSAVLDGGTIINETAAFNTELLSAIGIGVQPFANDRQLNGHIKRVMYFPKDLPDSEIQLLTKTLNL